MLWPDMWLLVQMLKWRHLVKWCQNHASIIMVLSGFTPAHKNSKKLFRDNIFYKWYKYIISLKNLLIKITTSLLIKLKWPYNWHVHHLWCFRHVFQSGDIDINNRKFLTRFSTKILVIRLANGRWAGGGWGRILDGVKLWFPLNNFSLLWPIHTKLTV